MHDNTVILMRNIKLTFFWIFCVLSIVLLGCGRGNKKDIISTDLINIPISADGEQSKSPMPKISFETTDHDFGKLMQGEKVSFTYKFKNTGTSDLIISTVIPGCGCTVAQFTDTPVRAGKEGFITINLNTESKKGLLRKKITVEANTYPAEINLWFSATVELP